MVRAALEDLPDLVVDAVLQGGAVARLVVPDGVLAGSSFAVRPEGTEIGHGPDSDVFLDDPTVSRSHARLRRPRGRYVVEDLGSLNGTYLNGNRVERAPLADGDTLQIGGRCQRR